MTSFEPTLAGFDDAGNPQFDEENRTEEQLERLREVHKGILDAYSKRLREGTPAPSKELADDILDMLNSNYSVLNATFFDKAVLDDSFCNRSFDLKSIVEG